MTDFEGGMIEDLLTRFETAILQNWIAEQQKAGALRTDLIAEAQVRIECAEFLRHIRHAVADRRRSGVDRGTDGPVWTGVREMLSDLSRSRARLGFSPSETATFVLSLKQPLFTFLRQELAGNADALFEELWSVTEMIDSLALYSTEVYQRGREEVIARQQEEMLELSTPVVKLWEGILALPLIGTLDSARTQVVMESLLQAIVDTGSDTAIIDITGVLTVDTLVSQHLLKTVAAARLMGAECIISGIRPQIAQTIVHLGVDLSQVATKATLADAFILALRRSGRSVSLSGAQVRA
jgi:rsbT co-antagonist protein RsbR